MRNTQLCPVCQRSHSLAQQSGWMNGHNSIQRTTPPQLRIRSAAFNSGMIATGNHNFERFAALCNTPAGAPRALRAEIPTAIKIPPYQLFGTEGFLFVQFSLENLHIIQQCLVRTHISAVHGLRVGEADGLQDLAQRAGNGNSGDGDELASIMVVGQPDFTADVIL